ncbi:MAG: radical SAM protein [Candidatus Micrarchaeia archaeon]
MEKIITKSVCPHCGKEIEAKIITENNNVYEIKTCSEHGEIKERLYDLTAFNKKILPYLKKLHEFKETEDIKECPYGCIGCTKHRTSTVLAIMEITNRCNLKCSYCFANSDATGYLYEPTYEQCIAMIDKLREQDPPCPAILISGGEPTIREDLIDMVKYARNKGMLVIIATNGYKIAGSLEYAKKLQEAGLSVIYLSFDGLYDKSNTEKKNHLIIEKIFENCRKAGNLNLMLVPAAIKGVNDDEVYEIIKFASKNSDIVRGVNFQPISFCGRMDDREREEQRYTISDLIKDISTQSNGEISENDFYPVPVVLPMINFIQTYTNQTQIAFSVHPLCGSATYIFKDEKGNLIPMPRFLNVDKFTKLLEDYVIKMEKTNKITKPLLTAALIKDITLTIDFSKVPKNLNILGLLSSIFLNNGDMQDLTNFHENTLFVGTMHFMDQYNADMERLKYCAIHYITPDLDIIPFCAYQSFGYRQKVENKWKKDIPKKE